MNLVLFGPPGAGKGTQSQLACQKFHLHHLSTGDAIRAAIRQGTEFGQKVKSLVECGELIPDDMVTELVRRVVAGIRGNTDSILFDGYPRTVEQVRDLDQILEEYNLSQPAIVNLEVPDEILMLRMTGRRICTECRRTYNVYLNPTRIPGVCDNCGGPLMQRVDDNADTVKERLRVYSWQTKPVLQLYENRGALNNIDGTGASQDVFARICDILTEQY
ncbi:adenylate kinase [Candidatus Poribacteria bacterium]|nr:adenylate kinase [Candidatus Poribacteria bacterium]